MILSLVGCTKIYNGTEALIDKVREEIPIANADDAEIKYAGMCGDGDIVLIWYISGNEYQGHTYFPIECEVTGEAEYKFIRSFNIVMDERCSDVCILQWGRGYSFCINNPKCKTIRITDGTGTYDEVIENDCYPYVFYTNGVPSEYVFLDSNGNELY